jgi:hypothetical protein
MIEYTFRRFLSFRPPLLCICMGHKITGLSANFVTPSKLGKKFIPSDNFVILSTLLTLDSTLLTLVSTLLTLVSTLLTLVSTLLTIVREGALLLHPGAHPATCPPPSPTGDGGRNGSAVWRSTRHARHPASPSVVVGERAGPAGGQPSQVSPCPPTSLVSPTWADVVRGGECASVEIPACPTPQPAVSSADFSACMSAVWQMVERPAWCSATPQVSKSPPSRAACQQHLRSPLLLISAATVVVDGVVVPPPLLMQARSARPLRLLQPQPKKAPPRQPKRCHLHHQVLLPCRLK